MIKNNNRKLLIYGDFNCKTNLFKTYLSELGMNRIITEHTYRIRPRNGIQ